MRILVFSDSHSALKFMFDCVDSIHPDAIVHLGDHYDDGQVIKEEYYNIPVYQVPGNCDRYRCPPGIPEIRVERIDGIDAYLTHGHKHKVKLSVAALLRDAKACRVSAVLFGHTHEAVCWQEEDGLWVMNPGSCGYGGGSCGLIETRNGKIITCRILRQAELEDMV